MANPGYLITTSSGLKPTSPFKRGVGWFRCVPVLLRIPVLSSLRSSEQVSDPVSRRKTRLRIWLRFGMREEIEGFVFLNLLCYNFFQNHIFNGTFAKTDKCLFN